ncbi:hypothetical protein SAMN05216251_101236 [Actinacidiphila alni]|uniref:Uncharacterized protein n=1 Tax=Actinacidiphila alni TaxID=380248 RepID=A0A1I1X7L8_9ACTN|nr:hypothetical protein SAMN05216251_101236 [Actinacidiphila alni]
MENLPGYDVDPGSEVSWLSTSTRQATLRPGQRVRTTVTLDGGDPAITGPGRCTAPPRTRSPTPVTLTVG